MRTAQPPRMCSCCQLWTTMDLQPRTQCSSHPLFSQETLEMSFSYSPMQTGWRHWSWPLCSTETLEPTGDKNAHNMKSTHQIFLKRFLRVFNVVELSLYHKSFFWSQFVHNFFLHFPLFLLMMTSMIDFVIFHSLRCRLIISHSVHSFFILFVENIDFFHSVLHFHQLLKLLSNLD